MIVAIDGPAGAGKSTVARQLAARLGFRFLDTGAMYRTVALAAIRASIDLTDGAALEQLARRVKIELVGTQVLLDGEDVTQAIRTSAVAGATSYPASCAGVRAHLVELQRQFAADTDIVTEGRDQGTIVFPQAECKVFLTASPEERARRRLADLVEQGESVTFEQVLAEQHERDRRDSTRHVAPLVKAPDAVEFSTDGIAEEEVVGRLESLVRSKMADRAPTTSRATGAAARTQS